MKRRKKIFSKPRYLLATFVFIVGILSGGFLLKTNAAYYIQSSDLFHDQATYFLSNIEPEAEEELTIRLRATKGLLTSADVMYCEGTDGAFTYVSMSKSEKQYDDTGNYDYWEATVTVPDEMFYYCFQVKIEKSYGILGNYTHTYYYVSNANNDDYQAVIDSVPDYTYCWKLLPGFSTPDWAKGATWYSLMPDAFFNGDPSNDDHNSDGNYDQPWNLTHNGLSDRYGGDLQGVMDKVDYIKSLGVTGICYNPITTAAQNGGYGAFDQNQIESTFGNGQTYSDFIHLMHENDLKLIQDVAIYFTPRDSIYYNAGNRWPLAGYAQGTSSSYYDMILDPETEAWGGVVLNNASQTTKDVLWAQPEAPLAKYINSSLGYGVDGYRFDVGGVITGKDESGNTVANEQIIAEMRSALKAINPDVLIISESSTYTQLDSGAWDGQWQLNVGNELRNLARYGSSNLFYMRNALRGEYHNLLRGVTLVSHNQLSTHDLYGCTYSEGNKDWLNAAKLIQMTALGSPSVYYGEETDFSGRTFDSNAGGAEGFSYFNWDESTWNQEVLNYHKALIELRNSYSALKDGAMYELARPTTDNAFYGYGRFDEAGAVVTYVNLLGASKETSVAVSLLGVADGEVMTDWFTGKTYTVSGGTITVEVPTGGTVFVTGGKRSSYVAGNHIDAIKVGSYEGTVAWDQIYGLANCNESSNTLFNPNLIFTDQTGTVSNITVRKMEDSQSGTVIVSNDLVTMTNNSGSIAQTCYSIKFINRPVYQNYSYSAYVDVDSASELAVMARNSLDDDSMYYAVKVNGTTLTVMARETKNGTPVVVKSADMGTAKYVKIVRQADNRYVTYLGTESGSTVNYELLSGSEKYLAMDSVNYVGASVLKGSASFRQEALEDNGRTLCDDFTSPVTSSMLSGADTANGVVSSGTLTLSGDSTLTTKSFENDWSYKAKFAYAPQNDGDYAGVICKQDEKSFVVAGRTKVSGVQKLFFAKSSNGHLVMECLVDDVNAASDVIVQLQRIGSAYSAVYSYDGKQWHALGESIFYNLSDENPGITVSGTTQAAFDYVSFGDAIQDGASYNTPRTPEKEVDLSGGKYSGTYALQAASGTWDEASEGLYQKASGVSQLAVENKVYDSFRTEATFILESGAIFAGMNFGKSEAATDISDGYLLKYTSDHQMILEKSGNTIASYSCDPNAASMRVVLECQNDSIVVYAGQSATPVMQVDGVSDTFGYFSYCTNGPAHVNNYNVGTVNSPVYTAAKVRAFDDRIALYASDSGTETITAYLREYAYTDFVLSTTLSMHGGDSEKAASAGLLLNGYVGANENECTYLKYSSDGSLCLVENGSELCTGYTVPDAPKSIKLMVVKQNGQYKVYVDNAAEPVMQFSESVQRGGVIAFASMNATTLFDDVRISEIGMDETYTGNRIYTDWIQKNTEPKKVFEDDFSSSKLLSDDYTYSSSWEIQDGTLRSKLTTSLTDQVAYVGEVYSDFVMTFKMKRSSAVSEPGFGGVSFRKLMPTDRYDESGITLAFYTGTLHLIKEGNADVTTEYSGDYQIYGFTPDVWHNIKVTCIGNVFKVYSDEELIFEGKDDEYTGGYISFRSGRNQVEYDDVEITPIDRYQKKWVDGFEVTTSTSVYDLLEYPSEGITMSREDSYVLEMDVCQSERDGKTFAFDLLKQEDAAAKPAGIVFSGDRVAYWSSDGEQMVDVNPDQKSLSLDANATYRYIFTVNAYRSIHVQVLDTDGTTVKYEGTVPWCKIYGLSNCTEDGNSLFAPNLIFANQTGTVSNVKVTYIDIHMLEVKTQSRRHNNDTNSSNTDIRFVGSVNALADYSEAGFVFSTKNAVPMIGGADCATRSTTTVYKKIYADNQLIDARDAGYNGYSKYMFVYGLGNFSTGMQIYARAYVKLAGSGTIVYGDVVKIQVEDTNKISKSTLYNIEGMLAADTTEPTPGYEDIDKIFN